MSQSENLCVRTLADAMLDQGENKMSQKVNCAYLLEQKKLINSTKDIAMQQRN